MFQFRSLIIGSSLLALMACRAEPIETSKPQIGEAPVADAGQGGTYTADQPISLNGDGSFDPDGDELTYVWSFSRVPLGSNLTGDSFTVNNSTETITGFLADTSGTYIVDLVVTDSTGLSSEADSVIVSVEAGQLPIAEAGNDVQLLEGDSTSLDGSQSADPLGRTLTYEWAIVSKPNDSVMTGVSSPSSETSQFSPDAAGRYLISLVVNNGVSDSLPDTITVDVTSANPLPPVADAGEDLLTESDCSDIQLNGSGSMDPNGDSLDYLWAIQGKPADSMAGNASFSSTEDMSPTFYADVAGEYILSLSVFDGLEWSVPDLVTVTTSERVSNVVPTVDAGSSISIDGGNGDCELAGYSYTCSECSAVTTSLGTDAGVSDSDGDPVTYQWYVMSGDATLSDPTDLNSEIVLSGASPTEPNACEVTTYELELVATDCPGGSAADAMTISVNCCGVEVQ